MNEKGSRKSEPESRQWPFAKEIRSASLLVNTNIDKPLVVRCVRRDSVRIATWRDGVGGIVQCIDVGSRIRRELTSSDAPIDNFWIGIAEASRRLRSSRCIHGGTINSMKWGQCYKSKQSVLVEG